MFKNAPEKTDLKNSREKIIRILKQKPQTANEVINYIHKYDIKSGKINNRSWKYYVHLNKLFSPMSKDKLIYSKGTKVGPTGKMEKIWYPYKVRR